MKGFIELHHNDSIQTFYFPVDKIGVAVDSRGASILFEGDEYYVDESIEEISAKIESTKGEVTPCGNIVFNAITNDSPTPRQNIYYRTEDRRPTEEDKDGLKPCPFCGGEVMLEVVSHKHGETYNIFCEECGAEIARFDKQEVINAWNRRKDDCQVDSTGVI